MKIGRHTPRRTLEAKLIPGSARIPLKIAESMVKTLVTALGLTYVPATSITIDTKFRSGCGFPVGSIRRRKPDVGDIDLVVTEPLSRGDVADIEGVDNVSGGAKQINFEYTALGETRKVNIFVFLEPETFGAALLHASGPYTYNVRIRRVAIKNNWKLSQNGLVDEDDNVIAGETEREVQDALGIKNRQVTER